MKCKEQRQGPGRTRTRRTRTNKRHQLEICSRRVATPKIETSGPGLNEPVICGGCAKTFVPLACLAASCLVQAVNQTPPLTIAPLTQVDSSIAPDNEQPQRTPLPHVILPAVKETSPASLQQDELSSCQSENLMLQSAWNVRAYSSVCRYGPVTRTTITQQSPCPSVLLAVW